MSRLSKMKSMEKTDIPNSLHLVHFETNKNSRLEEYF